MKQTIVDFFKDPITGESDYKKIGIAVFVLVLIVAYIVKTVRDKSNIPNTDNVTNTQSQSGSKTSSIPSTTTTTPNNGQQGATPYTFPYDVHVFAKEMFDFTQLTGYTILCRQPNNFCYHLLRLADMTDDFIIQLGKVYKSRYNRSLSDDIEKNGCSCSNEFVAAHTAYPLDKNNLLNRIKALGV
jgi:hypothetical protein